MNRILLFVPMVLASAANAQIHRCEESGRVVYSDQPCQAGSGKILDIKARSERPWEREDRERKEAFFAANPGVDDLTRDAVIAGRIFVGMRADAATASWGPLRRVNRSHYADGEHLQWVYYYWAAPGAQKYVYVRNGVVTAIQE
ncbi:MAG: DUF4124 domain-containing protein [Thauera sp.]|nr:DUF4124 domain-containing protein [Thauera sp.]